MPMLIDTDSRADVLVRAINYVLADHGPAGLTLRTIARASGVSTSSMLHHLGSREHLIRVAAHRTARGRLSWLRAESSLDGALAFIPRTADEVIDARTWLAWLELWRSEEFLERVIAEARDEERGLLASVLGYRLTRPELDAAYALIDGLLTAICSPRQPMRLDQARRLLAGHLDVPMSHLRVAAGPPL